MGLGAAGAGLGTFLTSALGVGAETAGIIGPGLVDAAAGAGLGAATGAATGGNIGQDALFGGVLGGAGGALGSALDANGGLAGVFGGASGGDAGAAAGTALGPASTGTTLTGSVAAPVSSTLPSAGGIGPGGPITDLGSSVGAGGSTAAGFSPISTSVGPVTTLDPSTFGAAASGGGFSTPGGSITALGGSGAPASSGGGFLGNIGSYIGGHPGAAIGGAGVLASLLANNSVPGLGALQNQANLLSTGGNAEVNALATGQLPQGAQASLDQSAAAQKAQVRSTFASLGLSGSTQEAEALSGVDQNVAGQKYQDLLSVTNAGLSEVGAADSLYSTIMNAEIANDTAAQNAIGRVAAALAGAGGAGVAA